ncbi:hypothetical protein ACEWY4_001537 [Coilia grayii]|uniref:CCHC-type domain-containing protein n=1 Tax=Coilia grayii TaxID=363190 RepID=A0ABD1KT65_9TELE
MAADGTHEERFGFLTRRHGIKVDSPFSVEETSIAVGNVIGHDKIVSASRMNRAVVLFLASVDLVDKMVESGVVIEDLLIPVLPLSSPSRKVILSNVPPFISNDILTEALSRYEKLVSPLKMTLIATKSPLLKHVVSFRRFAYIILKDNKDIELSLNVKVDDFNYMIYVTTNTMKCFGCGQLGHLARGCPEKTKKSDNGNSNGDIPSDEQFQDAPVVATDQTHTNVESGGVGAMQEAEAEAPEVGVGMPADQAGEQRSQPEPTTNGSQDSCVDLAEHLLTEVIGEQSHPMETGSVFKVPSKKRGCSRSKAKANKKGLSVDISDAESESDYASDCSVTCSVRTSGFSQQCYGVDDIKSFLSKTKHARNVKIDEFFPDVEQFIAAHEFGFWPCLD